MPAFHRRPIAGAAARVGFGTKPEAAGLNDGLPQRAETGQTSGPINEAGVDPHDFYRELR